MKKKNLLLALVAAGLIVVTSVYAAFGTKKESVEFYAGHSHFDGKTINAPSHSGGTDRYGCHNASVPYHCH